MGANEFQNFFVRYSVIKTKNMIFQSPVQGFISDDQADVKPIFSLGPVIRKRFRYAIVGISKKQRKLNDQRRHHFSPKEIYL
jgi:ribosomal protein S1